jgi:IPTL-CTERM motif
LAGTYRWIANYSGDANNTATANACNGTSESVVVNQVAPTVVTTASAGVPLGAVISDSATLSGGANPTGTILFRLYGPNDATCSGAIIFTATIPVAGNGTYGSGSFTPTLAGAYRWIANYSGDANNTATANACNGANESVVVSQNVTTLTTQASANVTLGAAISDSSTLSGGANPTGAILFRLYGPNDATCSGAIIFTATIPVAGNGTYGSGNFTPTLAGTYRWIANYSGDANNTATANACNGTNESVVVNQAAPTVVTIASAGVLLGAAISDSAVLSGSVNPTGTILFRLFGPNDATCTGAIIFAATIPVAGNGTYGSGNFTPTLAGIYRWIANYSGDANNTATANACNGANESVLVNQVTPTVVTTASAGVPLGGAISDSAVLSGGANPTGTILFRLYGPNDATCTGAGIFTSTVTVNGNGSYVSTPAFTPTAVGAYRWIANYGGDANNTATTNACNGANESVVVGPAAPNVGTNASPSIALGGSINDDATLSGAVNPTGTITFRLYGPDDAMCTGAVIFISTVTVNGNGTYSSVSFTPLAIGIYRWIANYSGDVNNVAAANTCNATNENVIVTAPIVITDVPTLSDAALLLLTMLLGMSGLRRSQQRRGRQ